MTRKEAAETLVEMIGAYRGVNKWDIKQKYYQAVSIACGVLLVDDVLKTNAIPPQEPQTEPSERTITFDEYNRFLTEEGKWT